MMVALIILLVALPPILFGLSLIDWYNKGLGGPPATSDSTRYRRCMIDLAAAREQLTGERRIAERMMRALTKVPLRYPDDFALHSFIFCQVCGEAVESDDEAIECPSEDSGWHMNGCPWIEARRWAEANPEVSDE